MYGRWNSEAWGFWYEISVSYTHLVEKPIEVEYVKPARSDKVQKIKTDKGIEIIIPVDYMNSRDFVEFKNQPDGTISIQLKNITRITSK